MQKYLIYCFRNSSYSTYYFMSVFLDDENSVGSPSYKYITLGGGLAFIEIMNVFFRTMGHQAINIWPNFRRDAVLILFRRKNLIIPLGQRISRSNESAGKQSVLYYRSGRKHELLRKNSHSPVLMIKIVLSLLWWEKGTVTPSKTERQWQSDITSEGNNSDGLL